MPFEPPPWSANPSQAISLSTGGEIISVDKKPYYVLGRDQEVADIHLNSEKASRNHAAIVHHTDGSVYIIDLKSSHGTFINGQRIPFHKPTLLRKRQKLTFGGFDKEFVVECKGDPEGMGGTVRASHLLVKHKDVRRPSSWKEPVVTRSKEDALAMIEDFHRQLLAGDPSSLGTRFAELAALESHCSSAKRGGDLGQFGPGQMQRPFEEATYALAVGQLSGPVFTDSGVHLILRTE